jgi:hypothetical protein
MKSFEASEGSPTKKYVVMVDLKILCGAVGVVEAVGTTEALGRSSATGDACGATTKRPPTKKAPAAMAASSIRIETSLSGTIGT